MKKNTQFLLALVLAPLFTFLVISQDGGTARKKPIYLHERIAEKVTKAWEPFLSKYIGKGDVILKFYAYYCGPCTRMASIIDGLAAEMPGFSFVNVQCEMFENLSRQFKIESIPTLIFLRDGKEIGRYDGPGLSQGELAKIIRKAFKKN